MDYRVPQTLQSLKPSDYQHVIVVFGSRHWRDKKTFHERLIKYLEDIDGPVLFLSGGASSGADDFIISWCKRYAFPCLVKHAQWQRPDGSTDKGAGFKRNEAMAKIATEGIGYWDQVSPGTDHMIEMMGKYQKSVRLIDISQPKPSKSSEDKFKDLGINPDLLNSTEIEFSTTGIAVAAEARRRGMI